MMNTENWIGKRDQGLNFGITKKKEDIQINMPFILHDLCSMPPAPNQLMAGIINLQSWNQEIHQLRKSHNSETSRFILYINLTSYIIQLGLFNSGAKDMKSGSITASYTHPRALLMRLKTS
jgi:hypothetical protein